MNVRARRSDAGTIRLTDRDIQALAWLADMKACYEPDLAVLLGRLNNREPLSATAVRKTLDRWAKAGDEEEGGLAKAQKLLASEPRIVFLLQAGAQLVGETTWRDQALWTAIHSAEVARARLWLEAEPRQVGELPLFRVVEWESERRFRQRLVSDGLLDPKSPKDRGQVHVPDGVAISPNGHRVAIEVERTPKQNGRLDRIVSDLLTSRYAGLVYFCATPAIGRAVMAAVHRVREKATAQGLPRASETPIAVLLLPSSVTAPAALADEPDEPTTFRLPRGGAGS